MTPAGLEPANPGSVGRCLIHWATGPYACLGRHANKSGKEDCCCDTCWCILCGSTFVYVQIVFCKKTFCTTNVLYKDFACAANLFNCFSMWQKRREKQSFPPLRMHVDAPVSHLEKGTRTIMSTQKIKLVGLENANVSVTRKDEKNSFWRPPGGEMENLIWPRRLPGLAGLAGLA